MEIARAFAVVKPRKWDGNRISMPGIYSDIPLDEYHGDICVEPSISSSGIKLLCKASPAHYWCKCPYNEDRVEDDEEDEKAAFVLGRAAHHLLFGEAEFKKVFALRPASINREPWHGNKAICKAWLKQQREMGLTVITPDQLMAIRGIARELAKDSLVNDPEGKREGILNGRIEHSWFWKHPSGVWLKARPDATPNDSLDFVDLKLTRSVLWADMQRAISTYGYYIQAGLTAMGVRAVLGQPLNSYTLVFAENKEPHCIDIVTLKENDIRRGINACEWAIKLFDKCMREKHWPGPRGDRDDARYIEMSEYDQKRIDETFAEEKRG